MKKLVLIRHGQSQWNLENRFTGWVDVELTETGIKEAHRAAQLLKAAQISFDRIYISQLKRAINTAEIILTDLQLEKLPIIKDWRLNERHYGALQGKNKQETASEFGEEQVHIWRRSFNTPPPLLATADNSHGVRGESLEMTCQRVLPYWNEIIAKDVKEKNILIVAHGNSLRALMKHLFKISEEKIPELELPTGVPILCQLDDQLQGIDYQFMSDTPTL